MPLPSPPPSAVVRALLVHALTASGILFAFLVAAEIASPHCDPRWVFLWFACATLVDAADGPLARRWRAKEVLPTIDGRTIDDLIDYLTFAFLPLLLIWRMGWVPLSGNGDVPSLWAGLWVVPGMAASLLGFANTGAKQEGAGFFRGFPSYWNIVAFYAGLCYFLAGPATGAWINGAILIALAALTVAPVRFVYPNLAPPPWKSPLLIGAAIWLLVLLAMLPRYPAIPAWAVWISLAYPALYTAASVHLDARARKAGR